MQGTLIVHTPEFERAHKELLHKTYAHAVGKPLTDGLIEEFETLYKQQSTYSALFTSLGLPSDFWQNHFTALKEEDFYSPEPKITDTLKKLKNILPISLFTNASSARARTSLKIVEINPDWFTRFLSGDEVKERKPALEGYRLIIEKSGLPANKILYVGDRIQADIIPARTVGMQTALVWGESTEADYSFRNFEDILKLVQP